ncbi:Glycosyltransferase [Heracleum sosnowskyi]|uniref:Glycosyltransferases n=1 Tax=Heracleum sosnowskyi TaxID=360622 RepID=A0AAD8HCY3_9APIA|nr:Glycosyltransferase [Heracleum sosnowskyi]
MKLSALQLSYLNRRSNSFRSPLDSGETSVKSPAAIFWLAFHALCCLISLILGFRFSRLLFLLLFTTTTTTTIYTTTPFRRAASLVTGGGRPVVNHEIPVNDTTVKSSGVVVGRHGILIRPWPHPNPDEVIKAHMMIERVQKEQRVQYGVKNPRNLIVITPTYVRTFQALHLTGLMHSLMNVPYDLTWIVVEAGGVTNETASLIARSGRRIVHIGFDEKMKLSWEGRHRMENRMRICGLRVVRDEKLDGIVMFADDSNMHSMELFDEIQTVKGIGAVSVGILAHGGDSDEELNVVQNTVGNNESRLPIQGPACNTSEQLAVVLPTKMEWAGFVLNSILLWEETEDKPEWVKDLRSVVMGEIDVESPLSMLKDSSVVEPLGSCGRKVMLWWLRVEARADSKFPSGWIIDPPLEVTVPAKRTTWPDAPPELLSNENLTNIQESTEKRATKTRAPRSKHSSRKRKHEARSVDKHISTSNTAKK